MSNFSEEIWILITRELSGEITRAEKKVLRQWLNEDPRHMEFYRNIKLSWGKNPDETMDAFFFDYESGLGKLRSKLNQERSTSMKKRMPKRRSSVIYPLAIAASVLLAISISVFMTLHAWEQPESVTSYATSSVEQRIITLSDVTVVRLNRDSRIDIEESNKGPIRTVQLQGEAFFDVTENPERSFVIHVDDAVVQVLGTSFNVKQGNEVMVAVQEGVVSLRHSAKEEKSVARLVAGQLGLLAEDGRDVKIEEANIENYLSWMNGYLRFDSLPFDQVIKQLERIYGLNHELQDSAIESLQLTVYTEQIQMEEVFDNIALALDLTYNKQDGKITWQLQE
jgi:transmembrane sensor